MSNPDRCETGPWAGGEGAIHRITAAMPGPKALVLGAVHGDEICGPAAITRVVEEIKSGALPIRAGAVTFVPAVNPAAFKAGRRFIDNDLNRDMRTRPNPASNEEAIANELLALMPGHDVLLDIHSYRFDGPPFIFVGPENNAGAIEPFSQADAELRYAASFGLDACVFGWFSAYHAFVQRQHQLLDALGDGPGLAPRAETSLGCGVTENFRRLGGYGVTIECGHHQSPNAIPTAYAAIRNMLAYLGLSEGESKLEPFRHCYRLSQVLLKHDSGDAFARDWKLFDRVKRGDMLAARANGEPITAANNGAVIFTYPNALAGGAWLYLGEDHPRGLSV